jgi:putative tryptophan/tyrosine transport system substrate-binding protein
VNRRGVITLLSGAAAAWPLAARAQQGERMRRIGVLMGVSEDDPETKARVAAFQRGLERRGWLEGRNLHLDYRFTAARGERLPALAKELVALQPDLILAHSTGAAAALQRESRTIPIVFVNVSDPIGSGFVASLARPGGNLTGVLHLEASIVGKWLAMLKEIAPRLTRAALMGNRKTATLDYFLQSAQTVAPSLAVELVASHVETAADIERAIESFARVSDSGLVLPPDATTIAHRDLVITLAARHRLPASTRSNSSSSAVVSCPTGRIRTTCFGWRHPIATASCAATNPPTFQCRPRPNLKRPSTLERRRRLA